MRERHVSIVVGGSRGIGQAIAGSLAGRGGNVFVIGRNQQRVNETVEGLAKPTTGRHIGRVLDAAEPQDMSEMAAGCAEEFGRVDLLVFSAAVFGGPDTRMPPQVLDLPLTSWQHAIAVNLHGVFLANRAVLPMMIAQRAGEILNIGSALTPHGMRGRPLAAAYSATKFALAAFTRTLATEVSEFGVRANVVFPGPISTPLIEGTSLAGPFRGQITAHQFAEALLRLLELPSDCVPADPYILPMKGAGPVQRNRGATDGAGA